MQEVTHVQHHSGAQPDVRKDSGALAWRNHSSTCVDPADPNQLWTCQQYVGSEVEVEWYTARIAFQRNASK